jgi:hypothetical protein
VIIISTYICGLFYVESQGEESNYGNIKHKSTSDKFREVYWNNISVFYSSGIRTNPDCKYLLFTNSKPSEKCSDVLDKSGVEIVDLPYNYKPEKGYWGGWQTSFYILDVLDYLSQHIDNDDTVLIMDIDIIVTRSLNEMVQQLKQDGFIGYDTEFPEDWKSNSVSRNDLKTMCEEINGGFINGVPVYYGGEIYGIHGRENLLTFYRTAVELWEISRSRWGHKEIKFNTEEHLFSCVFWRLGVEQGNANKYVKRMWTGARFRNILASDLDYAIWHLPAEKAYGIDNLSNEVYSRNSKYWTVDKIDFPQYVGKYVTVPHRKFSRYISDCFKYVAIKMLKRA